MSGKWAESGPRVDPGWGRDTQVVTLGIGLGGQIPLAGNADSNVFQELIYKEFFSQGDLVRVR